MANEKAEATLILNRSILFLYLIYLTRFELNHPISIEPKLFKDLYPGQSHPIGSDRNSSEVVGCWKMLESQDSDRIPDHSDTFPHSTTSDEFLSDPIIFQIVSDGTGYSRITHPGYV